MNDAGKPRGRTDRWMLLEVGLGLLLFGLAIYLYWIPAAREPFIPRWWSLPVLAGLFFGILWLHRWRRRSRTEDQLHEAVREVTRDAREEVTARDPERVITPAPEAGENRRENERVAPSDRADYP
jgi:hypothetical protein